jgi:hypothetical protein
MPNAPLRPCTGGCGARVQKGKCPACARQVERRRGSAHQRGYTKDWEQFKAYFLSLVVQAGIVPCCGAALPNGPHTQDSQCQQQGLLTMVSRNGHALHLDHTPPLQDWERSDPRRVCDQNRVQLLCFDCHARKTEREKRHATQTTDHVPVTTQTTGGRGHVQ